ncbi:MAG TPA: hypothetical protein VHG09_00160 [Longimicrobiales bacterium]|nr:hypothetical protein [Longimicrobiales bacterium]
MSGSRFTRTMGALLWCVLLTAGASAQEVPQADTVHLRFAWTAGTDAQIETTRLHVQSSGTTDSTSGSAQYRMHVASHPEGLIVSFDEFVFPPPDDTTDVAQLNSLASQAAAMVPKVVVDTAGQFVRIEDVASVRARLDTLMTEMLEPEEAAAARETLATIVTEDALAGIAAQEWNVIVGQWAGQDLVVGTEYAFEEQASLPMMPGAVVTMISTLSIARRTSCGESDRGDDCVEIRLVSRPDPEEVAQLLTEFTEQLLATPGLGIAFESFEMTNEVVLVTEPSTLRPHHVRTSKSTKGVVSAEGERGEVSRSEVRTFRYTYAQ